MFHPQNFFFFSRSLKEYPQLRIFDLLAAPSISVVNLGFFYFGIVPHAHHWSTRRFVNINQTNQFSFDLLLIHFPMHFWTECSIQILCDGLRICVVEIAILESNEFSGVVFHTKDNVTAACIGKSSHGFRVNRFAVPVESLLKF
jgi:hypothetical protein